VDGNKGIDQSIVVEDNAGTEAAVKRSVWFLRIVLECAVLNIYSFVRAE